MQHSTWFIAINILIVFLQWAIVQFGDRVMACSWEGLNVAQWVWTIIISSTGLLVSLLIKVSTPNWMVADHGEDHEEGKEGESK